MMQAQPLHDPHIHAVHTFYKTQHGIVYQTNLLEIVSALRMLPAYDLLIAKLLSTGELVISPIQSYSATIETL